MKYLTIIVVFLVAVILMLAGMLLRLMHWPYGYLMMIVGIAITLIAVIVLLRKRLRQ